MANSSNLQDAPERIYHSALTSFASFGFDGARIDTIAEDAKINKRMIYHYFGNKESLYLHVFSNASNYLIQQVIEKYTPDSSMIPTKQLERILRIFLDVMEQDNKIVKLFIREAANDWNAFQKIELKNKRIIGEQEIKNLRLIFTPILQQGISDGIFRDDQEILLTFAFITNFGRFFITMLPRTKVLYPDIDEQERKDIAKEQLIKFFINAIKK